MYRHDFESLAKRCDFADPRIVSVDPITIRNAEIERRVGAARFFSVTYRLFKLPDLEERCEDYGQTATYRGGIEHHEALFILDDHHVFEAGRPEVTVNVDREAAARVGVSTLDVANTVRDVALSRFAQKRPDNLQPT